MAFGIQIYGDFSGYTDIARGVSRLFGIELVVNFKQPYLSRNITEFWRRWHISLSDWLRDYLYIPLGRQPRRTGVHDAQPDADDAAGRPVARRSLELRAVGRPPRCIPDGPPPHQGRHGQQGWAAVARHPGHHRHVCSGPRGLGVLPGRHVLGGDPVLKRIGTFASGITPEPT